LGLAIGVLNRFDRFSRDPTFGAENLLDFGDKSQGSVDAAEPQPDVMDAATFLQVSDRPGNLLGFRRTE
jgi:hypothetical protein